MTTPRFYLVIDLEATTSDDGSLPPVHMERLEIATRREFCALLALAGLGVWRRTRGQQLAHSLFEEVTFALEGWQHKHRRADELAYESDVTDHLGALGFDVTRGRRLDGGGEAGIIVRPNGGVAAWNWRDVLIEVKADLTQVTERDRAMRQIETHAQTWPGSIILMICGDHRPDLLVPLDSKVSSLRAQGRPVAMIVRGSANPLAARAK